MQTEYAGLLLLKMQPQYSEPTQNVTDTPFVSGVNMSAAFYTRRRQCFTVAAEKFDTCGGGI